MKKFLAMLFLGLSVCVVNQAVAQSKGGFVSSDVPVYKVKSVKDLADNTPVVLFGKIEKTLGDEKYLFSDGTDSVVVEIDDDDWGGLTVTPKMNVKIVGEVDKELMEKPEIEVKTIEEVK